MLAVEYPGYGEYPGRPSEEQINADSEAVFDFLTRTLGVEESSIHLLGRSIGSGPAVHLASVRNPRSVTLLSAYMSIRKISNDLLGSKKE